MRSKGVMFGILSVRYDTTFGTEYQAQYSDGFGGAGAKVD